MREVVVAVAHADEGIRAVAALARGHEGRDARRVRLEREREQVIHDAQMLGEIAGDALGLWQCALRDRGLEFLRLLDLHLSLSQRGEILVHLAPVGRAEFCLQGARVVAHEIEDAAAAALAQRAARDEVRVVLDKEALEDQPRIEERRHRRVLVPPRDVVLVSARVAAVARASLPARRVAAQFQRGEARVLADLLRGDLVGGNADVDVRARRLARMHAGEEARICPRMIARAIAERAGIPMSEPAEHGELRAMRRERFEGGWKLEGRARGRGRPVRHVHAVGHIDEDEPLRRADGRGPRRRHAFERRQCEARADAAEEAAAGEVERAVGDVHGGFGEGEM